MARPLSPPFIRHLGEVKHRTRQLLLGAEMEHDAAIATAGKTGDQVQLDRAITEVREQLRLLEERVASWKDERGSASSDRGAAIRAEIRGLPKR